MPRVLASLVLGSLALLLPACAKHLDSNSLVVSAPADAPEGGPAVDVSNFRGSVDIRVKPWVKDIGVSYDVLGDAGVKDADGEAARAAVTVHAEMDRTGELPVLVVRTGSAREVGDHSVRLRIEMPACSGVRVINHGGEVRVWNTSGAVQVENDGGAVEVKTAHAISAPYALSTTGASIYLRAARDSSASVDALSEGGRVVWDAADSSTRVTAFRAAAGKLTVGVNEGAHAVLLRTSGGDIHVSFLEDPVGRVVYFK